MSKIREILQMEEIAIGKWGETFGAAWNIVSSRINGETTIDELRQKPTRYYANVQKRKE